MLYGRDLVEAFPPAPPLAMACPKDFLFFSKNKRSLSVHEEWLTPVLQIDE